MTKDGGKGYGRKPNSMYRFYPYYGHNTTPKYLSESTKDEKSVPLVTSYVSGRLTYLRNFPIFVGDQKKKSFSFLQKELEDLRKKVEQAQVSMKQVTT